MPVVTKTVLKSYFEDGKEPDENKYIDLIDTMAIAGDIVSDHGGLTGLGDDDHTIYLLADGSRTCTGSFAINGALTVGTGTAAANLYIRSAAGQYGFVEFYTGGSSVRWRLSKDNDAESGSNVGSSFSIYRYSDAGGYLGRPIQIVRSNGDVYFNDGDIRTAGGLSVGNTGVDPAVGDIKAQNNISANGSFYGQNAYYYEGGTYMGDFTAQDTTWFRINQGVAKNIYTPRYFAAAAGLQAGGSTNPGTGYVGYTAGLRPNKNSTQYYTYGYFGSASYYSSTAWDGDAKGNTGGTKIDLSAVFGVPAAVKAVNMRILGKANNAGPTDAHWFFCGPSATYDAHSGVYLWGNVYMSETGIVSCDANGDIYYTISSTATCYCIVRILGYFI